MDNSESSRRFDIFVPIILIVVGYINLELIFSRKVVFGALAERELACEGEEEIFEKICRDNEIEYWKPFPVYLIFWTFGVIVLYGVHKKLYQSWMSKRARRVLRATLGILPGIMMIAGGLCLKNFGDVYVEGIGEQRILVTWNLLFVGLSIICSIRYLRE